MESNKVVDILSKIIQKTPLTQEEEMGIEEWQKENNVNRQIYTFAKTQVSIDSLPENAIEYRAIYERIKGNIKGKDPIKQPADRVRKITLFQNLWKYAAVFAFGIICTIAVTYITSSDNASAFSEVTVPKGSVSEVMLPDSSIVTINSNSKLSYASNFLSGKRIVNLEGEAFFKVKKQMNGNEFAVYSKGTRIVVKGTEFNVRAYQDVPTVEATLVKGAIDFCADNKSIALKPNQHLTYNIANQQISIEKANTENTEWRNGQYAFKDMSLQEVIPIFNRIYNANILLDKTSSNIIFSGHLDRKKPLIHSLEIVTLATGTHYQIVNDTIYLKK